MGSKPNADLSLPANVTTPPKTQKGEEENWKVVKKTETGLKQSFFNLLSFHQLEKNCGLNVSCDVDLCNFGQSLDFSACKKKNMNPPVYECGRIGTGTQLVVETFSNDLDLAFMMRSKHNMSKSVNNIIRE